MKLLSKFFLDSAGAASYTGFLVGMILGFGLGLLILGSGDKSALGNGLIVMFLTGLFGLILMTFIRRIYIMHVSDWYKGDYKPDVLLRVYNDKVIDSGKALWRSGQDWMRQIMPFSLDTVVGDDGFGIVEATLRKRIPWNSGDQKTMQLTIVIKAYLNTEKYNQPHGLPYGYDPQELYDEVVKKRCRSVKDLILMLFANQVMKSAQMRRALRSSNSRKIGGFSRLAGEVNAVFHYQKFEIPLSNFAGVTVNVDFERKGLLAAWGVVVE